MPERSASGEAAVPDIRWEAWKAEYEQISNNFRALAEVRFKLLALVPTLGGVAVFLLSKMTTGAGPASGSSSAMLPAGASADYAIVGVVSVLGFLATLGITVYDQRNSELYKLLFDRGKELEGMLEPPLKNFLGRKNSGRHLLGVVLIKHDIGLALIYAPVLGAWFFPLMDSILRWSGRSPTDALIVALISALIVTLAFFEEVLRLDKRK